MKERQSIDLLKNELEELESKRQDSKIYYMSLFYDMGTPFYGDVDNLKFHLDHIDQKCDQLRKDIIEKHKHLK